MFKKKIKDIGIKHIWLATIEILSFLWASAFMGLDISSVAFTGTESNLILLTAAFAGFMIFAITTIIHISSLSNQITNSSPNLIFKKPYYTKDIFPFMEDDPFYGEARPKYTISNVDFLRIDICNIPKYPTEFNHAKSVRATVNYYNAKGIQMGKESKGRWATGNNPTSKRDISKSLPINIRSDGEIQTLDLAIFWLKSNKNEGDVCIFNNETVFLVGPFFPEESKKDFRLDNRETFVHIELNGFPGKAEQWLKFRFRDNYAELLSEKPKFNL